MERVSCAVARLGARGRRVPDTDGGAETSSEGTPGARGQFSELFLGIRRSRGVLAGLPGLRVRKPFTYRRQGNILYISADLYK